MNTTIIFTVMFCVLTYAGYANFAHAELDNSCIDSIISDIKAKYTPLEEEKAKNAASTYSALKTADGPYRIKSVSQTWTNDPVHCTATLKSILVQYESGSDSKKHTMTVIVDPNSYSTKNIIAKEELPTHGSALSPGWGGYAIKGSDTESTSLVYRSTMNWLIPTPNDPAQLDCGTLNAQKCYASVWTGISKTEDGMSDMAQVGTDSICLGMDCGSGRQYKGWLETVPGGHISDCSNNTFAAGDSMYGEVTNQKKNGGAVNKYDFYLIDTTQGQTCSALGQTFGTTDPHYGLYMTERPNFGGTLAHLADFGSISNIYGTIWYNGVSENIRIPYSAGSSWYKQWMMNNGVNNESISDINSSNYFSINWVTSQGT